MIRSISKNALALSFVALVCVAVLGTVNILTKDKINEQMLLGRMAILHEVLPDADNDRALLADCILVIAPEFLGNDAAHAVYRWRQNNTVAAYIVETTAPDGYSGNIEIITAITPTGNVLGTRVLSHQETPGLGDKVESRRSDWIYSFSGKLATIEQAKQWAVKKDGGDFDQFTGATITPRAIVNAVYRTAQYVQQHPELADIPANCEATL